MAMLFLALVALFQRDEIVLRDGLAIGGVSAPGRRPIPRDAIVDLIVAGKWKAPQAGDTVNFGERARTWHKVSVNKDGAFEDAALGNGYLFTTVDEPADTVAILNATGDTLVYVNGVPRPGDPYGYGYLNLPVNLYKGTNELLFVAGRGPIKVKLLPASKSVSLQSEDATLPDLIAPELAPDGKRLPYPPRTKIPREPWASVVVLNAQAQPAHDYAVRATLPDGSNFTVASPEIPPLSVRKLPFRIPEPRDPRLGKLKVQIDLMLGGQVEDTTSLEVNVVGPLSLQRRTFVSGVDGSVQYFAVRPAAKPSRSNALVLTLHGAGVEGSGQAAAYAQKDWATIVAATNRRPYGFDWEEIGRLDALEVLAAAKQQFPHDPARVDLTGHSMGGHGTWAVGTLYPNLFASIAPSAGWISFWSYAGGWEPENPSETEKLLRRSMSVGETLGRVDNTLAEDVYILHGDVDDNVPVGQARTMKRKLEEIKHPHLQYHEEPGASHWWGNQCVDWPPIFEMIKTARLDPHRRHIDFTTQNPGVSARFDWLTIEQQLTFLEPTHVIADRSSDGMSIQATTKNARRITLSGLLPKSAVTIDGQRLASVSEGSVSFESHQGTWEAADGIGNQKSADRSGPFKQVLNRRMVLVVGTTGSDGEDAWTQARARLDAETLMYRGNGAVDVVLDRDYSWRKFPGRNVILYGNADTNGAWKDLLGACPIQVERGHVTVGTKRIDGEAIGGLLIYPNPHDRQSLVAAVSGTGLQGFRGTDRLPFLGSGVAYPDWILIDPNSPGWILGDGFFGNDWSLSAGETAWARP